MSQNAILVKFSTLDDKLCEKDSVNIDNVSLNEELYQLISDNYLSKEEIIESDCENTYLQEIISINDEGKQLLELIKNKIRYISDNKLSKDEENIALNELTVLLNFRKIYLLKREQYKNDSNVVLIIG